ncbi:hypothetical protein SCLCIDRAFT_234649 [Scleroderma citrinum Foug A]|uniref:Uncharacterized protein n=1 Tax=Scleroderma citrinum Foug A TaxID=1036808 RepID=A0A0C3E381_9AGAM|nr:hypothetical protein SCLCIDRAFT_234649 [Scleroderma citrinum Foug A]
MTMKVTWIWRRGMPPRVARRICHKVQRSSTYGSFERAPSNTRVCTRLSRMPGSTDAGLSEQVRSVIALSLGKGCALSLVFKRQPSCKALPSLLYGTRDLASPHLFRSLG